MPPGASSPPPPPTYTRGACPTLTSGVNQLPTQGGTREFILVLPADPQPGEEFPVVFLWHWLGGSANSFLTKGEVQAAATQQRFIAVIPEAKDDPLNVFKWPYSIVDPEPRVQEELAFFDDMFACLAEQQPLNLQCVSTGGVSAGALWTDQLAGHRGQYFSSILSMSGGTGGLIKPWISPAHKMPAFVLWGGPTDQCVTILFELTSKELEQRLNEENHFFVECVHNCAHAEPPFDPPPGKSKYAGMWQFFLDHPYWLADGASPWAVDGLPPGTPEWCGIGAGSAVPRVGDCPPPACPF